MKNLLLIVTLLFQVTISSCKDSNHSENPGPKPPPVPEKNGVLNITDCGAVTDGKFDNTEIIQTAVNVCSAQSATLVFPAGIYYTRPLFLKSNVTLELQEGAIILGSPKMKDYDIVPRTGDIESSALIYGKNIENVKIIGKGKIDGQGGSPEFLLGNGVEGRPKLVHFISCKNITLENITLTASAFWTAHFLLCDGIKISGVNVFGHANWNNDGFDIDSKNAVIDNCYIDCDDDGICMKSDRSAPCENVTVKNCTILTNCNAIKLGTAGKGGFKNIKYTNCIVGKASEDHFRKWHLDSKISWLGITGNPSGVSGIALECVDGGDLDGVTISDITMTDVQSAIFIRLGDRLQTYNTGISKLRNVVIENVKATTVSKLAGGAVVGIPGGIIDNVTIKNVEITVPGGGTTDDARAVVPEKEKTYPENRMFGVVLPAYGFYVRHAKNITFENVKINKLSPDKRTEYKFDDVENYIVK
jgi:polygalacturonase